ncbi:hypothetical protein FSP39_008241 [Pinctada imbricata]|uniref:Uncharacterized protein n=1 Tax=Pinctada imbricata TaxID=66713 RepID=A0AA88XF05_PINIB|nr:hypothetical protein FSP39_008241 [Pinctada imbricata]
MYVILKYGGEDSREEGVLPRSLENRKLSERLISDISVHADRFQGSPARLQLTKLGFKLYVKSGSGQVESTDFIPVQNIQELSVNKYKPTCLMCVMRDGTKGMSILAWRCLSEKDSFDIIKGFTFLKRSLGGEAEGYNVLLRKSHGNNWSLGRKEGTRIGRHSSSDAEDPYTSIKATKEVTEGRTLVKHIVAGHVIVADKAVQTELDEDGHSASVSIDSLSVKDELSNLTDEVNAIKDMLENVMGVSGTTYYRKEVRKNKTDMMLRCMLSNRQ